MKVRYCAVCGFVLEEGRPASTCPACQAAREVQGKKGK